MDHRFQIAMISMSNHATYELSLARSFEEANDLNEQHFSSQSASDSVDQLSVNDRWNKNTDSTSESDIFTWYIAFVASTSQNVNDVSSFNSSQFCVKTLLSCFRLNTQRSHNFTEHPNLTTYNTTLTTSTA